MALIGRRDGRNFGWGWQLSYAGSQSLRDMLDGRHYGTVENAMQEPRRQPKWGVKSQTRTEVNFNLLHLSPFNSKAVCNLESTDETHL